MTHEDITNKIAFDVGITQKEAKNVINAYLAEIKESVFTRDESIMVRGFGTWKAKTIRAHDGFNPNTRKKVKIPEITTLSFKPSKRSRK